MEHIGNYYWPRGIPPGSSVTAYISHYTDPDGVEFHVCYTQAQIDEEVSAHGYFAPYITLLICATYGTTLQSETK